MIVCVRCSQENAPEAKTCTQCGYALDPEAFTPPRLLAQIQGLIPAEPIISSGRLRTGQPPPPVDLLVEEPEQTRATTATASVAAFAAAAAAKAAAQAAKTESLEQAAPEPEHSAESEVEPQPEAGEAETKVEPALEQTTEATEPIPAAKPEEAEDDLMDAEPPTLPVPAPALNSPWLLVGFVAFLAAILLGMRAPDAGIIKAPRRPAVETAYTFIEILPPNARVLLAWDYEPTTQGEMQLLANPILLHLRRKRARIANLSLRPTGPAVAADAGALVEYFDSSILPQPPSAELGFIPGDAAALRALSMSPAGTANLSEGELQAADMDAQDDVEAFDLIIEFSAETAATQEWVEQIAARQETPLIVAASGAVAPVLRPYEQSGQIAALLSGYADALAYERLTGVDGPAAAQRNPQSAAHLLLIAIIVLTLLLSLFRPSPAPAP